MGEGTVFSLFVSPHLGGGYPSQVGGYPIPGLAGGYPIPGLARGVPHPRSGWGVSRVPLQPGLDGVPPWTWDGVPPRTWDGVPPGLCMGYPTDLGWGTPPRPGTPLARPGMGYPPDLTGVPPQHSEYLLCGGQYASCVHSGGLSCLLNFFTFSLQIKIKMCRMYTVFYIHFENIQHHCTEFYLAQNHQFTNKVPVTSRPLYWTKSNQDSSRKNLRDIHFILCLYLHILFACKTKIFILEK